MKSLVTLHLAVLHDAGLLCDTDTKMDGLTLVHRVEHEGESFLTITLPSFVKLLEKGLHDGRWPQHGSIFKMVRGLPAFMRGFLLRVFDNNGHILDDPDANAIWAVRQVGNLSQKIERDCTPDRVRNAFDSFISTDNELRAHFEESLPQDELTRFSQVTLSLFGEIFDKLETSVANFDLIPRHGPGAVAEKLTHPQRWDFGYWTERLEEVFPSWRYSSNAHASPVRDLVPVDQELPVRVVSVPKTQKTPRIIAIEPSTVQYAQQGLKREIYRHIARSPLNAILGFTDQERNQKLAHEGSITGNLATLDLSEASDRVHVELVSHLLERWPHLRDFVMATRSRNADLNGSVIELAKFASMGSALTFPIEAIIFTVIATMGVEQTARPSARLLAGRVSVYGDDIVVPVDAVDRVVHLLGLFGFKVNMHKSFWNGQFRESCGKEYFDGTDVSVVRLRSEVPTSRDDAALISRFTDFRNRAYRAGLWQTVKLADTILDRVVKAIPIHIESAQAAPSGFVSRESFLKTKWRASWNDDLQTWQERHLKAVPNRRPYKVDGEGGLLKWFFENHDRSDWYQTDLYEGQERAHTFRIKWVKAEVPA